MTSEMKSEIIKAFALGLPIIEIDVSPDEIDNINFECADEIEDYRKFNEFKKGGNE